MLTSGCRRRKIGKKEQRFSKIVFKDKPGTSQKLFSGVFCKSPLQNACSFMCLGDFGILFSSAPVMSDTWLAFSKCLFN